MSTLTSASTDTQVMAEYDNTASWEEDLDVGKAKRHITACGMMLQRRPMRSSHDGSELQFDVEVYERRIETARSFVRANSGAAVRHVDFSGFRS